MKPIDSGCSPHSHLYFFTPSTDGKRTFFYPLCAGHYYCDSTYRVKRESYDSFLLLYARSGSMYLIIDGKKHIFGVGSVMLIDCYKPHIYGAETNSEIAWVHFDGATSREYFELITKNNDYVSKIGNNSLFNNNFDALISTINTKGTGNDALLSMYLVELLTAVLTETDQLQEIPIIEKVKNYIRGNITSELSLETLANIAGLSPYYFVRLFKKETGYTPHAFVINCRIDMAKFFLKTSSKSIKEICYATGFQTESAFCLTFKKVCGVTPSSYKEELDSPEKINAQK